MQKLISRCNFESDSKFRKDFVYINKFSVWNNYFILFHKQILCYIKASDIAYTFIARSVYLYSCLMQIYPSPFWFASWGGDYCRLYSWDSIQRISSIYEIDSLGTSSRTENDTANHAASKLVTFTCYCVISTYLCWVLVKTYELI